MDEPEILTGEDLEDLSMMIDSVLEHSSPSHGEIQSPPDISDHSETEAATVPSTSYATEPAFQLQERLSNFARQNQSFIQRFIEGANHDIRRIKDSKSSDGTSGKHNSILMREKYSSMLTDGRTEDKDLKTNEGHELLRAKLMQLGVWYENVDSLIKYCDHKDAGNPGLEPADSYPLRLHKATCLCPSLGFDINSIQEEELTQTDAKTKCPDNLETGSQSSAGRHFATPADVRRFPTVKSSLSSVPGTENTMNGDLRSNSFSMISSGESEPSTPRMPPHPAPGHQSLGARLSTSHSREDRGCFLENQLPNIQHRQEMSTGYAAHVSLKPTASTSPAIFADTVGFAPFQNLESARFVNELELNTSKQGSDNQLNRLEVDSSRELKSQKNETELLPGLSSTCSASLPGPSCSSTDEVSQYSATSNTELQQSSTTSGSNEDQGTRNSSSSSTSSSILNRSMLQRSVHSPKSTMGSTIDATSNENCATDGQAKFQSWTDEEEEYLIDLVEELDKLGLSAAEKWNLVTERMHRRGFRRTQTSIRVRWSVRIRHIVKDRKCAGLSPANSNETRKPTRASDSKVYGLRANTDQATSQKSGRWSLHMGSRTAIEPDTSRESVLDKDPGHRSWTRKSLHTVDRNTVAASTSALLFDIQGGHCLRKRPRSGLGLSELKSRADDWLRITHTWTGASHDMNEVAWSPDGTKYVAGSSTLTDEQNRCYNRPYNLLLGNTVTNELRELPDHYVRNQTSASPSSDSKMFETISDVHWSESGRHMYSASYDQTVKVWDVENFSNPRCVASLNHTDRVVVMSVARPDVNLLVTGTNTGQRSLQAYCASSDWHRWSTVPLPSTHRGDKTFNDNPNCVRFGTTHAVQDYLAAGFGRVNPDGSTSRLGFLGMWRVSEGHFVSLNVQPHTQTVFDIAWSPSSAGFVVGSSTLHSLKKNPGARTTLQVYHTSRLRPHLQLDCPALDINEVGFCPFDEKYLTASCTDGATYVWDCRRPDHFVHKLKHGLPTCERFPEDLREIEDVGVRFAVWGNDSGQFLTGASDGVIKQWDIRRNPQDVLTKDVMNFGIELMCGRFSPDKTSLLVGDACGSLHILSKSPDEDQDHPIDISFVRAPEKTTTSKENSDEVEISTQGRDAARELVQTGQITIHPTFGPGKGPFYHGPYSREARGFKEFPEDGKEPEKVSNETLAATPLLPHILQEQRDQTNYSLKRLSRTTAVDKSIEGEALKSLRLTEKAGKRVRQNMQHHFIDLTDDRNPHGVLIESNQVNPKSSDSQRNRLEWDGKAADRDDEVEDEGLQQGCDEGSLLDEGDDFWFPPHSSVDANLPQVRKDVAELSLDNLMSQVS